MARGGAARTQADTAGQTGLNFANTFGGNAQGLYGFLAPELTAQAAAPPGIAPNDLAAMRTAAMQSAGGSQAGATGAGGLLAARTRNAGAAPAAIASSARSAGRNLSETAAGIEGKNAQAKLQQRAQALSGLGNLEGEQLGAATHALGIVPQASEAAAKAASQGWDWARYILDPMLSASGQAAGRGGGG